MCGGPSPTPEAPILKTAMIERSAMVNSTIAEFPIMVGIGDKEGEKNKNGNKYIFKAQKILRK